MATRKAPAGKAARGGIPPPKVRATPPRARKTTAEREPPAAAGEPPRFREPKNEAAAADRAYEVRDQRLAVQRTAEAMKAEETFLKEWLIERLPASDATGVVGRVAQAVVKTRSQPQAEDWPKIYASIVAEYQDHKRRRTGQEDGAFAVLNRALNSAAVEERWESGGTVPGVGRVTVKSVSLTRVK